MKNIMVFERYTASTNEGLFKKKKPAETAKPEEVAVPEELKANGPNEKLFTGSSSDREIAKKKAREQANREGYKYETSKAQLKGTQDNSGNITSYTYQIVMKKGM